MDGADLQLLEKESVKGSEFVEELGKAQRQAARIEMQKFDHSSSEVVSKVKEAATNLLTTIIEFFDASLSYFSGNIGGIHSRCSV
jgi:hypothetical protein